MKKTCIGIIIGSLLLYFSLRGIEYSDIKKSFANVNFYFLIHFIFIFLLILFLKSIRWGIILSPIRKIKQKELIPITCVGNMAVILFPLRIGEFVKPYLISNSIPLSSGLATIFVERVIDILFILFSIIYMFFNIDIPEWLITAIYSFLIFCILLIIIGIIFFLNLKFRNTLFNPLVKKISEKLYKELKNIIETFTKGFLIVSEFRKIIFVSIITVLIWFLGALAIYCLYFFLGINLSFESAFIVLTIIAIGVSVPAAPGFLGSFQFACILALSIFNISKADAIAFSIIYYIFGIGLYILLGFIFVPFTTFSFRSIKNKFFTKQKNCKEMP